MRRFGWIGAGVLLLGVVAVLAVGYTAIAQTNLLPGQEQTERAVEPTGAEKEPPKPVQEPEKEVTQQEETKQEETEQEEAKTDEPDEELSNEEQIEVADSFSAPKEPASASASASASNEASASASAAASAPADTTM